MADNESDLETDGLELALDTLCIRHCSTEASLNSKEYCSAFCKLVEEYTGQWHVPLPQLKVLRTALHCFTKATAAFPDDCQHIHYVISSLALSFFELMLFFSKEEFVEEPLKDILDSFQGCHNRLLRHRNVYLQHVKQIIKAGGPWENPVLREILKETKLSSSEIGDYLGSELPVFFELRVRYLQACERMQEAMALAKLCLENQEVGNHLYFHQAYLTCLYKASLYESLHKEMAEIDGRDAVEIICNTESVEKDELLLSLCKAFLTQQLHNGDMYYIWDLVFIWSRLHLRAHPSREGFLAECLQLAPSATNVRAIFPFIKLLTTELGNEGVQVCVELCARALQLCGMQADAVTQSLVCKTIAFLLPHDLEICRACALLVFCQERSLEAYRTVCLLYTYPDQEPHPNNSPVRTCVRFHILQMLKERLCFDPEFWNLLTLRTHCLELISDTVMKAVVLNEMKEEEEKENNEEIAAQSRVSDSCAQETNSHQQTEDTSVHKKVHQEKQSTHVVARKCVTASDKAPLGRKRNWTRRLRKRKKSLSDDEFEHDDDPEFKYNLKLKSTKIKPIYSLRRNNENSASLKLHLSRSREYLSRCVKNQFLKRKGRQKKLLQMQTFRENNVKVGVERRGRKPFAKLEISYPDNEMHFSEDESGFLKEPDFEDKERDAPRVGSEPELKRVKTENDPDQMSACERRNGERTELLCSTNLKEATLDERQTSSGSKLSESPGELQPAVEADPTLDGLRLELLDCPIELFHNYSIRSKSMDEENPPDSTESDELNGNTEEELQPAIETEASKTEIQAKVKRSWRDRVLRTQQYAHLTYHCNFCHKDYKGLNVMRHALSHLKSRKLKCILCGKHFKQLPLAQKHVLDHIDSMCKEKPVEPQPCKDSKTPAANGTIDNAENQGKQQPPVIKQEQKSSVRVKVSSLKKEERIIRNLRTLIKKTSVLHKKSPSTNIFKHIDFKDEQVVIADSLVIVKGTSKVKAEEEQEEGGETPTGENGYDLDTTYHLCPSESCDKVFLKVGATLTKHAIKCHISEDKVLEKTFVWAKQKCTICFRQFQFLEHYKDHMKLHNGALPHFCYHLECDQRLATQQELKDHIVTHQPFRPQCPFTDCESLFPSLMCLHDHEWRHYIPAPQKEELELGPRQNSQSDEAPWKQRVKVEQLWLQNKKGQRESSSPTVEAPNHEDSAKWSTTAEQAFGVNVGDASPTLSSENCAERTVAHDDVCDSSTTVNGHELTTETGQSVSAPRTRPPGTPPTKRCRKKPKVIESDPINVRHLEGMSTLAEGIHKNIGEPHITEHKSFKPEDPAYATFVKAPFIRPPPSTYLDESVLAMRKRRTMTETPQRVYVPWNQKKKEPEPEKEQHLDSEASVKTRHRCEKCLSSFSTPEELQTHQSQNKCSSLFGFDSDDES